MRGSSYREYKNKRFSEAAVAISARDGNLFLLVSQE